MVQNNKVTPTPQKTFGALEQFKSAMLSRGLIPPAELVADGRIRRCDAEGKGGRGDGAYLLHLDGIPAGGLENHRDGLGWQNWRAYTGWRLTPAEEAANQEKVDRARRERDAEEGRLKTEARARAARLWAEASPCASHSYLTIKGLSSAHGARLHGDSLLIPLRDETGVLHSIQFIYPDAQKRFLRNGRVKGCYFAIGKPTSALCLCEGFATGATIFEVTGHAVTVAFDAGNLLAVARLMRAKWPTLKIIICADDDFETAGNPGLTKATEAARMIGGLLALPSFKRTPT